MLTYEKGEKWTQKSFENEPRGSCLCRCVRMKFTHYQIGSAMPLYSLWAMESCTWCQSTGIPPIPCSEFPSFYPEGAEVRSGAAFNLIAGSPRTRRAVRGS